MTPVAFYGVKASLTHLLVIHETKAMVACKLKYEALDKIGEAMSGSLAHGAGGCGGCELSFYILYSCVSSVESLRYNGFMMSLIENYSN